MFKNNIFSIILILFISIITEIFIFNFKYFIVKFYYEEQNLDLENFQSQNCKYDKNTGVLFFTEDISTTSNREIGIKIFCMKFFLSKESSGGKVITYYSDESYNSKMRVSNASYISPDLKGTEYITLITDGKCTDLSFSYEPDDKNSSDTEGVSSIILNSPYFNFNYFRALLLFLVVLLLYFVKKHEVFHKRLDSHDKMQKKIFNCIIIASVLFCFLFYISVQHLKPIFTDEPKDIYGQLVKSLTNNRFDLMLEIDEKLKNLTNPYDPSERDINNVNYTWDAAYYNGKYYCYFGIGSVITLLLPFKILTEKYLTTSFACTIFTALFCINMLLLYKEIIFKWYSGINFLTYISSAIALIFSSNIFWILARSLFYELAIISGLTFLIWSLRMIFLALETSEKKYIFFSGLFLALMVASRPNLILYSPIIIPFLYKLIYEQRDKLISILYFFIPIIFFASLIMFYNNTRFDSVFEFGAKYQLTVADMTKLTPSIYKMLLGLTSYIFQPLNVDLVFPFFHVINTIKSTSTFYMYSAPVAGILNFPIVYILIFSPKIIKNVHSKLLKIFLTIGIISSIAILMMNILAGGIIMRYLIDTFPMLVLISVILWIDVKKYFNGQMLNKLYFTMFKSAALFSCIISFFICIMGESNSIKQNNPILYNHITKFFEFF